MYSNQAIQITLQYTINNKQQQKIQTYKLVQFSLFLNLAIKILQILHKDSNFMLIAPTWDPAFKFSNHIFTSNGLDYI